MSIFKAYDVRGLVPEELDPELARRIGRAIARSLSVPSLVVGRDARSHSPALAASLIEGLRDQGSDVVDVGLVATPMLYFAVEALGAGGGAMVTASHNPARYNGLKICREHAIPVGGESGLAEIERLTSEALAPAERRGELRRRDVVAAYASHVRTLLSGAVPPLRVAIDSGNGMASVGLEPLLAGLPLQVERLYFEPDGTFPHHEADPLEPENLRDVSAAVQRSGAHFGVAFDGDADRAVFVDEHGRPVSSDLMTALLARPRLRRAPGARVLYDLRSSRATAEAITEAGGVPQMCRVGHAFIKAQMRESGAVFAGELSGHFYFRFASGLIADDGIAAFVALLDVLATEGRPLSELVAPLRRYAASGEINRRVKDVPGLLATIERTHAGAPEISRLDGLLVRYADWWFSVRPSNTEPLVRLNLEADTPARMAAERDRLLAVLDRAA